MSQIELTEHSHGAVRGCKITPALTADILKASTVSFTDSRLLLANSSVHSALIDARNPQPLTRIY